MTELLYRVPGIYFGMPADEYHKDPSLSASGIRNLLISPLDYWVQSNLNPAYVDEKTSAMIAGTAFHHRLLEPDRYPDLYGIMPTIDDYPGALDGQKALYSKVKEYGIKGLSAATVAELCDALRDADPALPLWPDIKADLLEEMKGKTILPKAVAEDIERAAKFVLAHQAAAKAFTGGQSEVSVFWIDEETGVRMKCRFDYLKVKAIIDLKTFSNPLGKPIHAAVAGAVASGRYDVQAVIYLNGVEAAKKMLREQKTKAIHIMNGATPPDDWFVHLAACQEHAFVFVFIEQGPVTNVVVREFRKVETHAGQGATFNMYWSAGESGFREGLRRYSQCMAHFGPDKPWIEDAPMMPFIDQDFPLYLFS